MHAASLELFLRRTVTSTSTVFSTFRQLVSLRQLGILQMRPRISGTHVETKHDRKTRISYTASVNLCLRMFLPVARITVAPEFRFQFSGFEARIPEFQVPAPSRYKFHRACQDFRGSRLVSNAPGLRRTSLICQTTKVYRA